MHRRIELLSKERKLLSLQNYFNLSINSSRLNDGNTKASSNGLLEKIQRRPKLVQSTKVLAANKSTTPELGSVHGGADGQFAKD